MRARRRGVGLAEALEDVRQELGRDALARVGDDDLDLRVRRAAARSRTRAAARRELDRVRRAGSTPPAAAASRSPKIGGRRRRLDDVASATPLRVGGRADRCRSPASTTAREVDAPATSRRSLPVMMRDTSSRSSMSCACARALRSMVVERRAPSVPGRRAPLRSIRAQPRIALSGVRSSCDSVARNSSLARFAALRLAGRARAFSTASAARAATSWRPAGRRAS